VLWCLGLVFSMGGRLMGMWFSWLVGLGVAVYWCGYGGRYYVVGGGAVDVVVFGGWISLGDVIDVCCWWVGGGHGILGGCGWVVWFRWWLMVVGCVGLVLCFFLG